MSYANRKQMRVNRTVAIIVVALIHVVLGYVLVTGLAYNVVKKAAEDLKTFDVEDEPPPPPEEPPPPPEECRCRRRRRSARRRRWCGSNTPPPPIQTTPVIQPVIITPRADPAPPAPPRRRRRRRAVVEAAKAKGNLTSLFSTDDYPPSALRNEEQGTTAVRLTIGPDGRVTGCTVTASSGSTCARQRDLHASSSAAPASRRPRTATAAPISGHGHAAASAGELPAD